jgi:hypothetical protein
LVNLSVAEILQVLSMSGNEGGLEGSFQSAKLCHR